MRVSFALSSTAFTIAVSSCWIVGIDSCAFRIKSFALAAKFSIFPAYLVYPEEPSELVAQAVQVLRELSAEI